jgi:hypothetical protein
MTNKHSAKRTQDHEVIRKWVEARDGRPTVVESTWDGESGLLRIDFGEKEEEIQAKYRGMISFAFSMRIT